MTNKIKVFLLLSCLSSNVSAQVSGKVEHLQDIFGLTKTNQSLKISTTVWYLNDQSIQQVHHINSKVDSAGEHITVDVKYYLFIDPNTREYFYYRNFSDTSAVVHYFKGTNGFSKYGGWDLYFAKIVPYDNRSQLSDTAVGGEKYGRISLQKTTNGETNVFILYTLCKNKNIPIKYFKAFSEGLGCAIVRMDSYYQNQLVGIDQLNYISNTLTDTELKVFHAWQSNQKEFNEKQNKGRKMRNKK